MSIKDLSTVIQRVCTISGLAIRERFTCQICSLPTVYAPGKHYGNSQHTTSGLQLIATITIQPHVNLLGGSTGAILNCYQVDGAKSEQEQHAYCTHVWEEDTSAPSSRASPGISGSNTPAQQKEKEKEEMIHWDLGWRSNERQPRRLKRQKAMSSSQLEATWIQGKGLSTASAPFIKENTSTE